MDGLVSSGGLGGPAILPQSLAKVSQMTQAFPERAVLRHWRRRRVRARAELLPARLRNRPGLHRGDARPRHRAEHHQEPHLGPAGVSRPSRRRRLALGRGLSRPPSRSNRDALEDPAAGLEGVLWRPRRARGLRDGRRATRNRWNHDHDHAGTVGRRDRRSVPEAHVLRMVGSGRGRSDSNGARQGGVFLDTGRKALHRFQQPADVRQHRPRRRTRHPGDQGAGGRARVCQSVHGDRAESEARRETGGADARATSTCSSSRTAAPRRTRTR